MNVNQAQSEALDALAYVKQSADRSARQKQVAEELYGFILMGGNVNLTPVQIATEFHSDIVATASVITYKVLADAFDARVMDEL